MFKVLKEALEADGKFRILAETEQGANSFAYKAHHRQLDQDRFIKCIEIPKGYEDSILKEPKHLVRLLKAEDVVPNVVTLYDAEIIKVDDNDFAVLQMEYVEDHDLQWLIDNQYFGQQDAVRAAVGICDGLIHMHQHGLLHRDLKPGNIMMANNVAKISDFGSVAKISDGSDHVNASRHSDLYVPPEAWQEPGLYTFSSDLYQLALVLYQMINGSFPTNGSHYVTRTMHRMLKREGLEYSLLTPMEQGFREKECFKELTAKECLLAHARRPRPYFSKKLSRFISRACSVDMNKRFTTASSFRCALSRISVPNWKPQDNYYIATNWRNWNWMILPEFRKRIKTTDYHVKKARTERGHYRNVATFENINAAFEFVENT